MFSYESPTPGVYSPEQIPMDDYHGKLNAVGRSALKLLDEGVPADVQRYLSGGSGSTQAMAFGTAFGLALLEPDEFARQVIERPAFAGANAPDEFKGAGAKERVAAWKAMNADKLWLDADEMNLIREMVAEVRGSKAAQRVLSGDLRIEHTIVWEDADTGFTVKARPDIWRPDAAMSADVKCTAGKLTDREVSNYVASYYAHLQGAMCLRGLKSNGHECNAHTLIMVSKARPVKCRVIVMRLEERDAEGNLLQEPSWLEMGEVQFDALLAEYAKCQREGVWKDYGDMGTTLPVPAYVACKKSHYTERIEKAQAPKESAV